MHRIIVAAALSIGVLSLAGCGEDTELPLPVAGTWAGRCTTSTSSDSTYLVLGQSGATVTGEACESVKKDCYAIQDGLMTGARLTFWYSWQETTPQKVTAELVLDAGGKRLAGTYTSTKCGCALAVTIDKL